MELEAFNRAVTLEASFKSIDQLVLALRQHDVDQALVKILALNQDNEKNQIVLGAETPALLDFFPGTTSFLAPSQSTDKRRSELGALKVSLSIDLRWLWPDGQAVHAPSSKIINYFQYPEIRLSGFIDKCQRAPRALRRAEMDAYGRRALIMGIANERVYGIVVTDFDNPGLIDHLSALSPWPLSKLLKVLPIPKVSTNFDPLTLIGEITSLFGEAHKSVELRSLTEGPIERRSSRGAGLTLEALLGIPQNGVSAPDKHGVEIKAVGSGKVTVITTEPDIGYRHEHGVGKYLDKFGWDAPTKPGYRVFNGIHKTGSVYEKSMARLGIANWDFESGNPDGQGNPEVQLVHVPTNQLISGWSYDLIKNSWSKKHAGAIYVEANGVNCDGGPYPTHYIFGPRYLLGLGTSPLYFLRQLVEQIVVLDPADERSSTGRVRARTQWRVSGPMRSSQDASKHTQLPAKLAKLYDTLELVDVEAGKVPMRFQRGLYVPSSS